MIVTPGLAEFTVHALCSVRRPQSGLAAALVITAESLQAELAAAFLLPARGEPKLLAAGGPPGRRAPCGRTASGSRHPSAPPCWRASS